MYAVEERKKVNPRSVAFFLDELIRKFDTGLQCVGDNIEELYSIVNP